MDGIEASIVASRFAEFLAAMLLFGALSFRLYFRPSLSRDVKARTTFDRWLKSVLALAATVALLASGAWLGLEAANLGDGWSDALNARAVSAVLFQTAFGSAWIWQLSFAVALLAAVLFVPRGVRVVANNAMLLAISAALVAGMAWAGHGVMQRGAEGSIQLAAQVVHILAASAWLGSLPGLAYVLYRARWDREGAWRAAAEQILPRYSRAGYVAVVLILLTGCVNSWFLVGSVDALFSTAYGRVLTAKVSLVALMVGVALVNRFGVMPKIVPAGWPSIGERRPIKLLWRNVAIEQSLGVAVLALVSVLGMLPPAL